MAKMKRLIYHFYILFLFTFFLSCSNETSQGWTYIFDGKTFNGWHSYGEDIIGSQWSINNGELIFTNDENESGQDILTEKEYTNFELLLSGMSLREVTVVFFMALKRFLNSLPFRLVQKFRF